MGTKQSVSKTISSKKVLSKVKGFKGGGAYIPIPKKFIGKDVEVKVIDGED